jgi:hypothetical protein
VFGWGRDRGKVDFVLVFDSEICAIEPPQQGIFFKIRALSHPSKSEVRARPLATTFCLCLRAFLFHGHGVAGWPGHGASATLAQCTGGPRQVKWVAYDSSADDLARPLRGDGGLGEQVRRRQRHSGPGHG